MDVPQFLDFMMADFGIPCDSMSKSQLLQRLYNWLLDRYRAGETAVLVVDEAQNLSDEVLEEIRMLTNLETLPKNFCKLFWWTAGAGTALKQPQLRQLRQRLTLRAKTHPLNLDETKSYITQRLRIAGSNGDPIFDNDSVVSIFRYSLGIPRVINLLCEHCLVSGFVDQKKMIPVEWLIPWLGILISPRGCGSRHDRGHSRILRQVRSSGALRTLATLADRLRQSERQDVPKKGNYEPYS